MALRYLSTEWMAEARTRLEASPEFQSAAKDLRLALINTVTDAPGGSTLYIRYAFEQGAITDLAAGTDAAIAARDADFKVSGTYETFALLNQGKLSIAQAFLQRRIKLEGPLSRAMKFVKPFDAMNRVLRQIPTVY